MTDYEGGSMAFNSRSSICVLLFLTTFLLFHGCSKESNAWQTAPDFTLADLSDQTVSLKDYRGNIVLLDFWTTWCPPCRESIPELVDLQNRYRDQGVVILGISMDDPSQFNNRYLMAFKEKFRINYTILRANGQVARDYFGASNMAIPTLFVVNRKGKIVDKFVGFRPGDVERSLKKLL